MQTNIKLQVKRNRYRTTQLNNFCIALQYTDEKCHQSKTLAGIQAPCCPDHSSVFTVAAKAGGFIMKTDFWISCQKLVLKIRCQRSCWWGIINICSSLLYAIALLSKRVPRKPFSDINLILRGLLELLDETGGNREKVIVSK